MKELADKKVLWVDNGLFCYLAEATAPEFAKSYYFSPWTSAFPDDKSMQVGVGLPGITRADHWLPIVDEVDLIVFPDTYYGPEQEWLEDKGYRVWGSRTSENLELYREQSKVTLKEKGVPIGKFAVCEGMDELRDYLKEHENVLVKFSFTRGDKETFHVKNYKLAEPELDDLEHRLGPRKNKRTFIVEDAIEPACEIGYDCYTIDGEWPEAAMWGIEAKGKCYVGMVSDYDKLPEQLTSNNEKVAPILKKCHARSWFGMETRVTKKESVPFVIDPLSRFGNPPGALCSIMYKNLAEILYYGAEGKMVQPVFADKVGVQIQVYSDWSSDHWQPVYVSDKVRQFLKLQYHTNIDGVDYVIPTLDKNPAIGALCATGPTIDDAIDKLRGYIDGVEGPGIKIDCKVLDAVKEEVEGLKSYGIKPS